MHRFTNILGNTPTLNRLEGLILSGGLEGAFLFTGPLSIGKYTVARQCVRSHLCRGTGDSSCTCLSCRSGDSGCRDLLAVKPNRYGNILLDSLSTLEELLGREASSYPKKAVLIDDCDMLSGQVADRLLKSMESIGEGDLIILVSSNPQRVPPTIRSRSTEIRFHDLSVPEYMSIAKRAGHVGDGMEDLVRSRGSFSQGLLGNITRYLSAREKAPRMLSYLYKVEPAKALRVATGFSDDKESLAFFEVLVQLLSDLLMRRMMATSCTGMLYGGEKSSDGLNDWGLRDILLCSDHLTGMLRAEYDTPLDGFTLRASASLQSLLMILGKRKDDGTT